MSREVTEKPRRYIVEVFMPGSTDELAHVLKDARPFAAISRGGERMPDERPYVIRIEWRGHAVAARRYNGPWYLERQGFL